MPPPPPVQSPGRYRWIICSLLFFATTINYIDRQILSLLKPLLDQELHWTNEQFGFVNSFFQGAYALSYLAFGWAVDRYGAKLAYAASIAAWSLAAAGHALVGSVAGFGVARVALGLGEGGNFPAAIKTVAQWFPRRERTLATTLFNSGANIGALLAPAIIPPLALAFGWHAPFLVAGAAGFVWLVFWWKFFSAPRDNPRVDAAELALIESDADAETPAPPPRWRELLRLRQAWAYLLARGLTDPVWWFFLIWLPDYFKKNRGLDLKSMGLPLVAIYAFVTVFSLAGGWASKRLADRGWSVNRTRRVTLLVFACCVLPVALSTQLPMWGAVALIGLAGGAHQAWSATLFTTVSDVFPRRAVGSVIGLGGMVGSLAGMVFPIVCGRVLDAAGSAGYLILFVWCGLAYLIAFGLHTALCPRLEPVAALR